MNTEGFKSTRSAAEHRQDNRCPVCGSPGYRLKHLSPEFIRDSLTRYFGRAVPETVRLVGYDIVRCLECSLEFASPPEAGDEEFYQWVTSIDGYYPAMRWEWQAVVEEIKRSGPPRGRVLEVGCGSGTFLRLAKDSLPELSVIGLDLAERAVEQCRAKGIESYAETLEQYCRHPANQGKVFDYICAFHCLEHVSSPKELVQGMAPLTDRSSTIFLSTPYSPMSFETRWHDPLNHPPHHVTRWNAKAYEALAEQTGWTVDLILPPAADIAKRAVIAVRLAKCGTGGVTRSPWSVLMRHPFDIMAEMVRQATRPRVHGRAAPDVVLARLRRE